MTRVPVVTMWDDGLVSDLVLMRILERYSVTAAFALCPELYGAAPALNDARSTEYGMRVSRRELGCFADYEVCNHTATHAELPKHSRASVQHEVHRGKTMLEDLFGRRIDCFCYPYGCYNAVARQVVAEAGHAFARCLGGWPRDTPVFSSPDVYRIAPTARWNHNDPPRLIEQAVESKGYLLFWGHTYEMRSQSDWDRVEELYRLLTTSDDVSLVTFAELGQRLAAARPGIAFD